MRKVIFPLLLSEVFPSTRIYNPADMLKFRLGQLNRIESLRFCAHLNLFIADAYHPRQFLVDQMPLLRMFLNDRVFTRTEKYVRNPNFTFFHREQLLELMRHASLHCPDSAMYSSPAQNNRSKKAFLEAALLVSEILLDQIYGNVRPDEPADVVRRSTLEPLRHSARYGSKAMDPIRAFGRGAMMFLEYLPEECSDFLSEFEEATGLSLKEYYACLFLLTAHYLGIPVEQGSHQRHLVPMNMFRKYPRVDSIFRKYIALESQTADDMRKSLWEEGRPSENRFRSLRQKPILRLSDASAIVLDPAFHTEKATVGPLFAVPQKVGCLLMHFGSAFEKYAQGILRNMYPKAGDAQRRLILNQELGSRRTRLGELDACLIDGDHLFLFEMKGRWIKEAKIVEPNYEDYLNELRRKYGEAAQQLAEAVTHLITGQAEIEGHDIRSTRRLYPILLAYDSSLSVPGNTWFFESEFREALQPSDLLPGSYRIMTKEPWEVAPLTLITIDVLEDLEASVKNFSLADLLRDYFAFRDAEMQAEEDTLALPEFIGLSDYAEMIDTLGSVVKRSLETFKEATKMILPEELHPQLLSELDRQDEE